MQILRRLIFGLILWVCTCGLFPSRGAAAEDTGFTVATWNLRHFPSRNQNVKKKLEEPQAIEHAGGVLKQHVPDILCIQEMRDKGSLKKLLKAAEMSRHRHFVVSEFTQGNDEKNVPLWENVVIATRFPVIRQKVYVWKSFGDFKSLQRGFAFMEIETPEGIVHVYTTHLKSNYGTGPVEKPTRRLKTAIHARQGCMEQLVATMRANGSLKEGVCCIVAGDLNTQVEDPRFAEETTLRQLQDAGMQSVFGTRSRSETVTIPAGGGYPDATFDYIWFRGMTLSGDVHIEEDRAGSDHRMVLVRFAMPAK